MIELIFFSSLFTLFAIYGLYGPVMMLVRFFGRNSPQERGDSASLPGISLIIPAFNEEDWIVEKIKNSLSLKYPKDRFELIVVTDGSDDQTYEKALSFSEQATVLHEAARNGKIRAMDRGVEAARNEILVFSDANTLMNEEALLYIGENFQQPDVGMVAGEKRVLSTQHGEAASGEGLYWKYESWLKKLDSDVASVIGAAGELFAIRKVLYHPMPSDTLLDDFMLSTKVIERGYRVAYESRACAKEFGSASYQEEWKRKVRICAGGVQSVVRSYKLFNLMKYRWKSFSFFVHRVSRWTVAPCALIISFLSAAALADQSAFFFAYVLFGLFSVGLTWIAIQKNIKNLPKLWLLIVYFTFMHAAAAAGWFRYARGTQSVNWDRALRLSKPNSGLE